MRGNEIKVGGIYACKVSGKLVPVRLDRALGRGKWAATNTTTGRAVRVSSARLRWAWGDAEGKRRYYAPAPAKSAAPAGPAPTLQGIADWAMLRHACGYAISCRCGGILDARDAVLFEARGAAGHVALCGRCADRLDPDRLAAIGARVVCDGRTVDGGTRMVAGMLR